MYAEALGRKQMIRFYGKYWHMAAVLLAILIFASGCAGVDCSPVVKYKPLKLDEQLGKNMAQFYLAKSKITLAKSSFDTPSGVEVAKASRVPIDDVKFIVNHIEDKSQRYAVIAEGSLGCTTKLSVTYAQPYHILSEVRVTTESGRSGFISALFDIIGPLTGPVLGPFAPGVSALASLIFKDAGEALNLPIEIDAMEASLQADVWTPLIHNPGWWLKSTIGPVAPGAVPIKDFMKKPDKYGNAFIHSSCRDLKLQIAYTGIGNPAPEDGVEPKLTYKAKIADPKYVSLIPLPMRGAISMHSVCGANVSRE